MAYPFGFEFLREHFDHLQDWQEARFYFSAHPTTFASEFASILREGKPYIIFRMERRPDTFLPRHIPAHWEFTVYPVERGLKSKAREALCLNALAILRDFSFRSLTHPHYYNRCNALFDPTHGTCSAKVLHELDPTKSNLP